MIRGSAEYKDTVAQARRILSRHALQGDEIKGYVCCADFRMAPVSDIQSEEHPIAATVAAQWPWFVRNAHQAHVAQLLVEKLLPVEWSPEPHRYESSYSGMACGATVEDEQGYGEQCGRQYADPVHAGYDAEAGS